METNGKVLCVKYDGSHTWSIIDDFLTPLLLCQNPEDLQACQPQFNEW
jgi:hypothetical protein